MSWVLPHIQTRERPAEKTNVNQDAASEQLQPSRIRSITIFAVLVMSSISGAAFAQFTYEESIPESIGQPDTIVEQSPDPLAFSK